jgi:hypothetical protein
MTGSKRRPLRSSHVVQLLVIGVFCLGLTGCYTQLQLSSSASEPTRAHQSADAEAAFDRNWTSACYGARYGLARYYGSLCYSSITGRPWYAWLSDYSYTAYSPWHRLGDRRAVLFPYSSWTILPGWKPSPSTTRLADHRRAGVGRRAEDRSVRRDTSQRPSSRPYRSPRTDRRAARSSTDTLNDDVRVARTVPAEQPLSSPEEVVETRLDRVAVASMERRAQRLRRSTVRSLSGPRRVSLAQPEARAFLRQLVVQKGSGALSAREQAQLFSRLQRVNTTGDRASLKMPELPDRVRTKLRNADYTAPSHRTRNGADRRRAPQRDRSDWDVPRSDRADQIETERDRSAPRRTPTRESSSSEDPGSR